MSTAQWFRAGGADNDVVISTRVRLARNLPDTPFPDRLDGGARQRIVQQTAAALPNFEVIDMHTLPEVKAQAMAERHLISPAFCRGQEGSALLVNADESESVMVNEEDHVRVQVLQAGLALDEAYAKADALDDRMDAALHFAFDPRLGYLTQCPTNLGTGMRASLMLHLPALEERGLLPSLVGTVSKLGLTMRGLYGEGSRPEGAIYQLSNQITLGLSERAALDNLKGVAAQILREERAAREQLAAQPRFCDAVWRSLGVLHTARLLSHDEAMNLLSRVRTGVSLGILNTISLPEIDGLMNDIQPANILVKLGHDMKPEERDATRAEWVRRAVGSE
ncbi:MAG: protein arginine kinase [Oscillospiraceae bacterium]|nr:protein arginine kinase [Oscillospiraceae bacterium]